jgi:N6-adenosine-specific RNA methylase IME4
LTFPVGNFGVILADPPWYFGNWSEKGEEKNAVRHYPCMPTEDICRMPVQFATGQDCALFIWATWPMLPDALQVISRWGFTYKGLAWEWIKYNPETGKYAFGPGYGTRKNLEPCILATRGAPERKSKSVRDFIMAPRREHSRKPDEQYERIEALFDGPYLELFARQQRPGWTSWGNQIDKFGRTA